MNNDRINKWAEEFGMNVIMKYKFLFLAGIALLVVLSLLGTKRLVTDTSNESFLPKGDEMIVQNDRFKEIFGNEEFVFVFVEADNVFDHDTLEYVRTLSEDFDRNLPFAREVTSLTSIEYMNAYDDILEVEDLIGDEIPTDSESLEEIKRKVFSSKMYVDRIVTRDTRSTGILITFERMPDLVYAPVPKGFKPLDEAKWPAEKVILREQIFTQEQAKQSGDLELNIVRDPRKLIAPAVRAIIEQHKNPNYKVMAIGIPMFDYEGEMIANTEGARLGLIALVVAIGFLIAIFRSFRGVIAPVIVIILTVIIIYGIMGWLGMPISSATGMIPTLLLVISVSYSIHVINHFRHSFRLTGLRRESVSYSFRHAAWPCFITAVTTSVGFASFLVVPMKPIRDVGLACAIGVFMTYLLVIIIVPILFSIGRNKTLEDASKDAEDENIKVDSRFMGKWAGFAIRNSLVIGILACILMVGSILLSFRVRVGTDFFEMIGDKVEMVRNARYVVDRMGGLYSYEVLVELPEDGMAKEPEVLRAIDAIDAEVRSWESTTVTGSIVDMIKELNWVMHNKDDSYYTIPDSRDLMAQYLLLYEMSGGEDAEDLVDYEYRTLHLSAQVDKVTYSQAFEDKLNNIERFAEERLPEGTEVTIVGDIPMFMRLMNMLTDGQIKSLAMAFLVITLMMMLILKSFRVGLLSMVPNVFPVIFSIGIMGLLKIPLDYSTIMIAPMIIGIAVDDTVHYFVHFKQEYSKCSSYDYANRRTFQKVGYAIMFTSIVLVFGFSIFCLSNVKSMLNMGLVAAVGISSALAADLFITPVLFVRLKPFGRPEQTELAEKTLDLRHET